MQTILGAGGAIGIPLAKELPNYTDKIRLVGRNPKKINPDDELFSADLTSHDQVSEAVKGSDVVYLVAGLKYDTRTWQEQWPKIMNNVIEASIKHNSKLVFFDNVYMYGLVKGWMTEETPFNPCSRKGEVRAKIASRLIDAYQKKELEAVIVRSADFYGPDNRGSVFNMLTLDKLKTGKKANWLITDKALHTFTFTPDAAKATALIGNTPEAFNQTWHLPSDKNVLTGEGFIKLAADMLNVKPDYTVFKKWQLRMVSLFNPIVRESLEMAYQNEYDYLFDSSKYESYFKQKPTPYREGIAAYLKC